jgi:4-amino-4-deoxy-L-arabinose transferase-like glycosyltransferase
MTLSRDHDPAERAMMSTTIGGPGTAVPPVEGVPGLPQPEPLERLSSWDRWLASIRTWPLEHSLDRVLIVLCMASGAVTHAYHLFLYPLYTTDEGIYMQQAWSVLSQARLSPYTYFYDHAPGGWLMIAAYAAALPMQFQTFGDAINTGRVLMVLVHVASVFFLFHIAYRLSGRRLPAVVACFIFNFSPLAVFYQREVLLDNLMVFWILLSIYLLTREDRRVVTAALSGLACGMAVITKENAIFIAPVILYLLHHKLRSSHNRRFALSYWGLAAFGPVSVYLYYAFTKNELLPSRLNFSLTNPPTDHVSLLWTVWWQLNRNQGSILDPRSAFWQLSFDSWLPKDHLLLIAGGAAMLIVLVMGLHDREKHLGFYVAGLLAASYSLYLVRGSVMLEFYVIPLIPFLALNVGMLLGHLLRSSPAALKVLAVAVLMALLVTPFGGYVWKRNDNGRVGVTDMYNLQMTLVEQQELAYVRQNVPPSARIIMDDELWTDLHDRSPVYKNAHSHWKAAGDPAIRDRIFHRDWRNIDYVVMSNRMREAMVGNNGNGNERWILDAIDNHSALVLSRSLGNVEVRVYKIENAGGS